jgi:hypothetical protein
VFGPLVHAWIDSDVRRYGEQMLPNDPPISHGSGPAPDRVLVIGGPVVRGVGVASYDLALSGHLARKLALLTGRGVDVETRAVDHFDSYEAAALLKTEDLQRFDAVLLMLGMQEVVSLRSSRQWRGDIQRLLVTIGATVPHGPPVLIAGLPAFAKAMNLPAFASTWLAHRIERQNAETQQACLESGSAQFIPFDPKRAGVEHGRDPAGVYESWATTLVPPLADALAAAAPARALQPSARVDETSRQHALDALDLGAGSEAEVDQIVSMARDMLGMDAASITFIDHERQWTKASIGFEASEIPRAEAICNTTIKSPGVFIVEDMDQEPLFRSAQWTSAPHHVRFYAGYPLEAPGGARVGAICVMDRQPHTFSSEQSATLRNLALRVQAVLWEQAG